VAATTLNARPLEVIELQATRLQVQETRAGAAAGAGLVNLVAPAGVRCVRTPSRTRPRHEVTEHGNISPTPGDR
jgi:hypothetical protein